MLGEPVREGVPLNVPLAATDDVNTAPTTSEEGRPGTGGAGRNAGEEDGGPNCCCSGYGVKPASAVRYSTVHRSSKVGQVLIKEETSDERYQSTVGDANPWAPFASQTDWELARWAKLRGSKSTAFTDLLGVESVSIFNISNLLSMC